jgi:hypothetical protein
MKNKLRLFFTFVAVAGLILLVSAHSLPSARAAGPWYVSNSGNDSNDCASSTTPCSSINGALNKPGFVAVDTVNVAVGTYTGTGDRYSLVVVIDKNITLLGGWDATFTTQSGISTIDGQNVRRAVYINSGLTVTMERFKIQGGNNYLGGGGVTVDNNSVVTIQNSTISGNVAQVGGGISVGINATLTLNNSTVSGNRVFYSSSTGGGIDVYDGSLTVLNYNCRQHCDH